MYISFGLLWFWSVKSRIKFVNPIFLGILIFYFFFLFNIGNKQIGLRELRRPFFPWPKKTLVSVCLFVNLLKFHLAFFSVFQTTARESRKQTQTQTLLTPLYKDSPKNQTVHFLSETLQNLSLYIPGKGCFWVVKYACRDYDSGEKHDISDWKERDCWWVWIIFWAYPWSGQCFTSPIILLLINPKAFDLIGLLLFFWLINLNFHFFKTLMLIKRWVNVNFLIFFSTNLYKYLRLIKFLHQAKSFSKLRKYA